MKKSLLTIFYAVFASIANYCICLWGSANEKNLKNLETLQKHALKVVHGKPRTFSRQQLYNAVDILPIEKQFICCAIKQLLKEGDYKFIVKKTRDKPEKTM